MGGLRDLFVRIKGDNSNLKSTLKDTEKEVSGLGGKFKGLVSSITAAAAAGAAAFAVLTNWAKDTAFGLEAINVAGKVTKQILTDLIMGKSSNYKEVIANAKEQSKIQQDDIREGYLVKKMQAELNRLIVDAADNTKTHAEKLELLTKAMAKEKELKTFLLDDAKEELKNARDNWRMNLQSVDAKKRYYEVLGKIQDIEGMDSRRLQSQFTSELAAQKKRADDLVDAFTPIVPTLEEIKKKAGEVTRVLTGDQVQKAGSMVGANKAGNKLAGAPNANAAHNGVGSPEYMASLIDESNAMADAEKKLEDYMTKVEETLQQGKQMAIDLGTEFVGALGEAVGGGNVQDLGKSLLLSFANFMSTFGKMLITLGIGMKAFQESLKNLFTNPIVAIAAGVALIATAGIIRGAAQRSANSVSSGGSSGGGGGSSAGFNPQTIHIEGKIKGKDLVIIQRRYAEDN